MSTQNVYVVVFYIDPISQNVMLIRYDKKSVNILNNFSRTKVKVFLDNLEQFIVGFHSGAVRRDKDGEWLSDADCVRQLPAQRHTVQVVLT